MATAQIRLLCRRLDRQRTDVIETVMKFPCLFFAIGSLVLSSALHGQELKPASPDGITEPVFDVTLSFPDPGIISVENFKEGDFVTTNDVLIKLDSRLEQLEVDRRKVVMENLKGQWNATQAVFEKSSVSVSHEELLKKEADYKVALADYQVAVEQLRRRSLMSPRAGIITELRLHPGEACIAYQPIVRIVDPRQCYFVCEVEGSQSADLKKDQTISLQINGPTTNRVEGKVVFVSPVVDPASGLCKVRVLFDNPDGAIRPGRSGQLIVR
jgi:RND family efflux transporter MFP subunit